MDDDRVPLDAEELGRLRDAIRSAQGPLTSVPHREILDIRAATPGSTRLTVDYAATATLGMPLLVVRVPMALRPSPVMARLSPREFEVAGLLAAGWANKEIAARLGIRISTVKEHVHRILVKTELPSRAAIAAAYVGGSGPADQDADPSSTRAADTYDR
jgi:DNA-binding CsgD family transcriptional regulator